MNFFIALITESNYVSVFTNEFAFHVHFEVGTCAMEREKMKRINRSISYCLGMFLV